jgi:hypothetical protein
MACYKELAGIELSEADVRAEVREKMGGCDTTWSSLDSTRGRPFDPWMCQAAEQERAAKVLGNSARRSLLGWWDEKTVTDHTDEPGDEPGPVNVQPRGAVLKLTGSQGGYTMRDYMAVHHLWAAQRWARMCDEAESNLVADGNNDMDFGHRSLAVAAIMSSVAFLNDSQSVCQAAVAGSAVGCW